jgi:hypothetical protein
VAVEGESERKEFTYKKTPIELKEDKELMERILDLSRFQAILALRAVQMGKDLRQAVDLAEIW